MARPLVIEVVDKPRRAESRRCRGFYHVTGRPSEAPAGDRLDSRVGIPPAIRPGGKHLAQMDVAAPIIVALIVLITRGTVFGLLI
jgi:hypothetical protein